MPTPDLDQWRREALAHCLRMAATDPEYAQHAADRAERESAGCLAGLGDKVRQAIAKHGKGKPDAPRRPG